MGKKFAKNAINPTRKEDFPMWYQEVVKESELAEMAHARGCMVIKPWGYGIWENIRSILGKMIKDEGCEDVYFPLFIPKSYIQKEADHVDGFAKEMAVVTHHRLKKEEDGNLVPDGELSEPLIVRPTSETIIGESMSGWIKSYRDLPLKLNQWCNVVRWEMRPRVFLRTVEFLWQEGHTAYETKEEAQDNAKTMLNVYSDFVENYLAIPLIKGIKPEHDKFPGAVQTFCIEAMMQDGKALQAGTTHYLGENFAKSANIQYLSSDETLKFAHTSSWGVSTRLIGGLIMTHADDDGMKVPPKIAPYQVVLVPFVKDFKDESANKVFDYLKGLKENLSSKIMPDGTSVRVKLDDKKTSASDKKWGWIKKGSPIIVEVGMKDIEADMVTYRLRNEQPKDKHQMEVSEFVEAVGDILQGIQKEYLEDAKKRMSENTKKVETLDELKEYLKSEENSAFALAPYCEDAGEDKGLREMAITIRCIPFEKYDEDKTCVVSGRKTRNMAVFARSY